VSNGSEASLGERLNDKLHRLTLLLFVVYIVISSFGPVMDNVDLGWHIAQGRWMVDHFSLYRHDVFNYPNLGHPAIDEYPLFQVVLYLAWCLGWWGPCLFAALVYGFMFHLLLKNASSFGFTMSAREHTTTLGRSSRSGW